MSRRHRGRPHHHAPAGADGQRRTSALESAGPTAPDSNVPRAAAAAPPRPASLKEQRLPEPREATPAPSTDSRATGSSALITSPSAVAPVPPAQAQGGERNGQCTAPQLRRFIKSRPYVPLHELRRRFGINGDDDDVTPVQINPGWIYIGLPTHEGTLLGELLRTGEIGYELSLDPRTPIVIGVYPMRPIPRN
jgi:hypothetical protein